MNGIGKRDKAILRELAKQVAEIAALPVQKETVRLWKALNGLQSKRPMVLIDQIPWHEMNVNDELTVLCEADFCRNLETVLRRTLYQWKHVRADMVVEPFVDIPKIIHGTGFGISVNEHTTKSDSNSDVASHSYMDQIQNEEDIEKIEFPEVWLDERTTAALEERAHDIFDGILGVRMQGYFPNFAAWDRIAEYRGVQNILYDLVDRPEFLHKIISRYTEASLSLLDQLEEKNLLGCGQGLIHCSGAYTDELPASGFDSKKPRAKDIWTYGMAQMFSTVSPAMHEEFELEYAIKWHSRFGLVYYGCCEPLHDRIEMVRKIPNLRKVSMSPWVDVEKAAEEVGGQYVFSRKPNPAVLANSTWDPEMAVDDVKDTLSTCCRFGCHAEFILKDISTVYYRPERLWQWAERAMEIVGG